MKKESPNHFKNIAISIILILFTVSLHYFVVAGEKQETEATVVLKNNKKGLYLFPRYEVLVDDSYKASKVSKKTYDSIEVGDDIDVYKIADRLFVTEDQIQMERTLFVPVLIFLYGLLFLWVLDVSGAMKYMRRREKLRKMLDHISNSIAISAFTIWLLVGFIVISLVVTNVFHKLNKSNLIETEATVLNKDWKSIGYYKGRFITYELLLLYSDKEDKLHVTKKAVTRNTYNAYDVDNELTLFYRKNNVDDTFVQAGSFNEIWQAFVNLFTILIGIYFVSVYVLIQNWRKKLRKKKV